MKFEPVFVAGQPVGYQAKSESHLFFFGNRNADFKKIQNYFSYLDFFTIHQVHGDHLIEAIPKIDAPSMQTNHADAHWTDSTNRGLLISTADCVPVLVSYDNIICAIHAGWRGVCNEIAAKSLKFLLPPSANRNELHVAFGPHIQYQSFEISNDVLEQFLALGQKYNLKRDTFCTPSPRSKDKYLINLRTFLRPQLCVNGASQSNIFECAVDTMTNVDFYSYRRDREKSGRNLSFVARLK